MNWIKKLFGSALKSDVSNNIEMLKVPAGTFTYGFPSGEESKYLDAFQIMKYPVTVAQYRNFCVVTGQSMPDAPEWGWIDNHPMVNVSWHDANDFAKWAGMRLPTCYEWIKAARGTDKRSYPWGNAWDFSKCQSSVGRKVKGTAAVGQHSAGKSPYGVEDMSGNASEWTNSPSVFKSKAMQLAGGNWWGSDSSDFLVCEADGGCDPTYKNDGIGFRCVK